MFILQIGIQIKLESSESVVETIIENKNRSNNTLACDTQTYRYIMKLTIWKTLIRSMLPLSLQMTFHYKIMKAYALSDRILSMLAFKTVNQQHPSSVNNQIHLGTYHIHC